MKDDFIRSLKKYSKHLNKQELKTLRGQALAGDLQGANKGLQKILERKMLDGKCNILPRVR